MARRIPLNIVLTNPLNDKCTTYIFAGNVSNDIKATLRSMQSSGREPDANARKKLDTIYGEKGTISLIRTLSHPCKSKASKSGGNSNANSNSKSTDDDFVIDIDYDNSAHSNAHANDHANAHANAHANDHLNSSNEPTGDLPDDLTTELVLEDENLLTSMELEDTKTDRKKEKLMAAFVKQDPKENPKVMLKGITEFVFSDIFLEDTITELKHKVFVATGIQPYRQHVYWRQADHIANIYRLLIGGKSYAVNINNIGKEPTKLLGIPIDNMLFDVLSREIGDLQIIANDTFTLLDEIVIDEFHDIYVVDLNMFITNKQEVSQAIKDTYQFNMIMYGFVIKYFPWFNHELFEIYINNEKSLRDVYPEFSPNQAKLQAQFERESKLLTTNSESLKRAVKIEDEIYISLSSATTSVNPVRPIEVNLRSLFEYLSTSRDIPLISSYLIYQDRIFKVRRESLTEQAPSIPSTITSGLTIVLRADIKVKGVGGSIIKYLFMNIQPTGKWSLVSSWAEEDGVDFSTLVLIVEKYTKTTIDLINDLDMKISPSGKPILEYITEDNVQFSGIVAILSWKKSLTDNMFKQIRSAFEEYLPSGIIKARGIQVANYEFLFAKGMVEYDRRSIQYTLSRTLPYVNYYGHMYNPIVKQIWNKFYSGKIVKMYNRTTDLKIEIINIRENSFMIFYNILIHIISSVKLSEGVVEKKINVKRIKKLREQDPELYDLKRWGADKVYSKECQEGRQPLIHTDDEIADMSEAKKKKLVKFHNFTRNRPAWYSCPYPNNPHLNFMVGKHPNDWCLPCCGKKLISDDSRKGDQHKTCLKEFIYKDQTNGERSRHVLQYGKAIDVNRLGDLPSEVIDLISTYRGKVSDKNLSTNSYYIHGVDQHLPAANNIGIIFSLAYVLDMSIEDLIKTVLKKIPYDKLLNGTLTQWFPTEMSYKKTMHSVFLDKEMFTKISFTQFEELFIEIANDYFNLSVLKIVDNDGIKLNAGVRKIIASGGLGNYIVLLERDNEVYPIVAANALQHYKTGTVGEKRFKASDPLITAITNSSELSMGKIGMNFPLVMSFVQKKKQYSLKQCIMNNHGNCYAVVLGTSSSTVYVPIEESKVYIDLSSIKASFSFEVYEPKCKLETSLQFIEDYNSFDNVIAVNGFSKFNDKYVSLQVFVMGKQLNYYFSPVAILPKKYNTYPTYELLYDPLALNKLLLKRGSNAASENKAIGYARYRSKLYRLIIIEFIAYLNLQGNQAIRLKIRALASGFKNTDIKYSDIVNGIKSIFDEEFGDMAQNYIEDMVEISKQISMYYIQQNNIDRLSAVMDKSHYKFDQVRLLNLRKLSHGELKSELKNIFDGISTDGDLSKSKEQFPNLYYSCSTVPSMYCKDGKLVVKKAELESLLDILASDLLNPLKEKFFTASNMLNILTYFNFKSSIGEEIIISKV
jgi:hypothetical protein